VISEIDALIRSSLSSLVEDISSNGWKGRREREVVSLYCFGHLLKECRPGTFLHDVTQISIEVAVSQVAGQVGRTGKATSKERVCKDVVIWPRPRMTCWDSEGNATQGPTSILEWKHNEGVVCAYDVDWLREFSAGVDDFIGYAVSTNHGRPNSFRLSCTRVYRGDAQPEWLLIK
jgi:hypothetical protein